MARTTGPPGRTVPSKVFAVLDAFAGAHSVLTLSQVAAASGLPLSTARRLLQELVRWGGVERLPTGNYRIGMRLWELGSLAPRQRSLREAALPYMQDLYEAARQNVQLVVLDGLEALCVERIYGSSAVPTESGVAGRMPLHATAAGKALLAFSPPQLLHEIVAAGPLHRYTPYSLVEPARLARALRRARTNGLAYSREERALGVAAVAAPLLGPSHRLLGAIGVVTPVGVRVERLAPAVRTAAVTISRTLGRNDPTRRTPTQQA